MKTFEFGQRKKMKSTIVILLAGLVILFYFLFTVGIKLILNSSVFVANMFSKNSPAAPLNKTTDVYGSVDIEDIPVATNSAKIIVNGSVVNYTKLDFYLNGEVVETKDMTSNEIFNIEIGDLEKGKNEVYIKARTEDGQNTKKTQVYEVLYKDEKPKLDISEPADRATVSSPEVTIKGTTDKEVLIKVNDLPVVVDVNGNFDSTVRLKDGDNSISIRAEDIAGNVESKTLTVTYRKED
ncbi:MAG: hypothetical protein ACOYUB_02150 [Patescibacteria group bacterium]